VKYYSSEIKNPKQRMMKMNSLPELTIYSPNKIRLVKGEVVECKYYSNFNYSFTGKIPIKHKLGPLLLMIDYENKSRLSVKF
jgi:hypothetical protein